MAVDCAASDSSIRHQVQIAPALGLEVASSWQGVRPQDDFQATGADGKRGAMMGSFGDRALVGAGSLGRPQNL